MEFTEAIVYTHSQYFYAYHEKWFKFFYSFIPINTGEQMDGI